MWGFDTIKSSVQNFVHPKAAPPPEVAKAPEPSAPAAAPATAPSQAGPGAGGGGLLASFGHMFGDWGHAVPASPGAPSKGLANGLRPPGAEVKKDAAKDPVPTTAQGPTKAAEPATAPAADKTKDAQPPSDPKAAEQKPPPDPKAIAQAANELHKAMDTWFFTDKTKILDTLRGKSPEEVAAIKKEFKDHYEKDLDGEIGKSLKGKDLAEAQASMSGDPVQSAVASIKNANNGKWFGLAQDKDKMKAVLEKVPPEQRAEVAKQCGMELGGLSGNDKAMVDALVANDTNKVAAVKLDTAMNGSWVRKLDVFNRGWGTDKETINGVLENTSDQKQRDAIAKSYQEKTGQTLNTALDKNLSGHDRAVGQDLLKGDKTGAEAEKLKAATEGWFGTDKEAFYKAMSNQDPATREAIIGKYNERFGKGKGSDGQNFDQVVKESFKGLDKDKVDMLRKQGKLDDEFALHYAMERSSWSTDKELLKKTLDGKSKAEIDAITAKYNASYGQTHGGLDLGAKLKAETSGRAGFEIAQMMKGTPSSPAERRDRANEEWEFERGSGSNFISRGLMDMVSDKGAILDRQHQRVNDLYAKSGATGDGSNMSKEDQERLAKLSGFQGMDTKDYRESKDAAATAAATTAAVVAAAATTALTGGAAAPAWAAVFGTGAAATTATAVAAAGIGGLASLGTKAIIQGDGYSREDLRGDLLNTGVQMATAGLVKIPAIDGVFGKIAGSITTNPVGQAMLKEGLSGGVANAVNSGAGTAIDPATWQNADTGGALAKIGGSSLLGFGSGFAGSAASAGVGARLDKLKVNPQTDLAPPGWNPRAWMITKGTLGGLASGTAQTLTTADTYEGGPDAVVLKMLNGVGGGALSGGVGGHVEANSKLKAAVAKGQSQQPQPEAEQSPMAKQEAQEPTAPAKNAADSQEVKAAVKTEAQQKVDEVGANLPTDVKQEIKAKVVEGADKGTTAGANSSEAKKAAPTTEPAANKSTAVEPMQEALAAKADPKAKAVLQESPVVKEVAKVAAEEHNRKTQDTGAKQVSEAQMREVAAESAIGPKKELTPDEKTVAEWKKESRTIDDHSAVRELETQTKVKNGDQQALLDLANESRRVKPTNADDARVLRQLEKETGIAVLDRQHMTPEAVLATAENQSGQPHMTPEEIAMMGNAAKKDAQASLTESVDAAGNTTKTDTGRDYTGAAKANLTPVEMDVLIKGHLILREDVTAGARVRKFVTNNQLGGILNGEYVGNNRTTKKPAKMQTDKMTGDIGLARNTDGLGAGETIAHLGLDYEHSPTAGDRGKTKAGSYTDQDASGKVTVSKEVQDNGLHYLEQPLSQSQADKAKVPLAQDLYDYAKQKMTKGEITPEQFAQFTLKNRENGADNPYTGTGMTAPNAIVDSNGQPFKTAINQEMNAGAHALQEGAQLKMRGQEGGSDKTVATYEKQPVLDEHGQPRIGPDGQPMTEMRWKLDGSLTKEQRKYYENMIASTQQAVQNFNAAQAVP